MPNMVMGENMETIDVKVVKNGMKDERQVRTGKTAG
jgi:hypothetical protein